MHNVAAPAYTTTTTSTTLSPRTSAVQHTVYTTVRVFLVCVSGVLCVRVVFVCLHWLYQKSAYTLCIVDSIYTPHNTLYAFHHTIHTIYTTHNRDDVARLHAAAGAMRDALLHTHTHLLHNNAPATSTSSSSSSDGGGNDRDGDNDNNDNNDDKDNKDDYYNKHDDNDQAAQQNTTTKQQAHDPAATHTITPHTTTTPHTNGNTSTPPTPAVYAVQLHGDKDGVLQGVVRQQLAAVVANALEIHPVLVSGDLTGGPHAGAAAVYRYVWGWWSEYLGFVGVCD